jgi:hypothetical protein
MHFRRMYAAGGQSTIMKVRERSNGKVEVT